MATRNEARNLGYATVDSGQWRINGVYVYGGWIFPVALVDYYRGESRVFVLQEDGKLRQNGDFSTSNCGEKNSKHCTNCVNNDKIRSTNCVDLFILHMTVY